MPTSVGLTTPRRKRQPPAGAVRAALRDAWDAGQLDRVADMFADDGAITLEPLGRRYATDEDRRHLLRHLLPVLVPGDPTVRGDGKITALTVTLAREGLAAPLGLPPASNAAPDEPARDREPGRRRFDLLVHARGAIVALLIAFGAVTGTVAALAAASEPVLNTIYGIWPELRPEGPPTMLGVTLSDLALEERRVPCDPSSTARCNQISYDLEIVGYTGAAIDIEWAAFDAMTRQRIPLQGTDTGNQFGGTIGTQAPNDRLNGAFRIPIPLQAQCIFVRVYAFDDDESMATPGADPFYADLTQRTRLDYEDTPAFHTHSATKSCQPGAGGSTSTATPA